MSEHYHVAPVHPGEVLQDELEEIGISPTLLAQHIRISLGMIEAICEGKQSITAAIAMKLSRALGASPQFWLNLQNNWELSQLDEVDYKDISSMAA